MKQGWLHALILCAAVFFFFHAVVSFPFLSWDDDINVTGNPLVSSATGAGLAQLWRHSYASLYVPVAYTWFWLMAWASRFTQSGGALDPGLFHAGNLLLHALCTLLCYRILSNLVTSPRAAFVGALAFALHPLVAESVAWVTEARGLLSAALAFTAIDLWLGVAMAEKRGTQVRAPWRYTVATLCFAAAMLAKPQAAALPIAVLVIDRFLLGRAWKRVVPMVACWSILAAVVALLTKLVWQTDETMRFVTPLWARPIVALDALGFYTWKTFVPANLTTDYGRTPSWLLESIGRAWPALVPLALVAALYFVRRARRGLVAYALFAAALLPVLGLVTFLYQDISTVADRYAYPALLGVALAVALLVDRAPGELQWAAAVVITAGLGTLSIAQTNTWQSNEALFTHVLEINPKSFKAEGNLGQAAFRAKRLDEAVAHYERALAIGPSRWNVHQYLGFVLYQQNKFAEAEPHLAESLRLRADNVGVAAMLGSVRLQLGHYAEAEVALRAALAIDPNRGDIREWLGTALLAQDKRQESVAMFQEALKTRDTPDLRKNLGQVLMLTGDAKGAVEQLRLVLKAKPTWPDAQIDLAWLLATAPDDADRNPAEAMSLAVRAQAGEKTPTARFLDTLAAAEAATGRFDEAAKTAERALKYVPADQSGYAERIEARRQAYASGKAWRDLVR